MKRCPRPGCNLAGPNVGDCGRITPCARPVEVDPEKDIVIDCRVCDKTWSIPVGDLVRSPRNQIHNPCPQSNCAATLLNVRPKSKPAKTKKAASTKKATLPDG